MHVFRRFDQLDMSIRNLRAGGIKHAPPEPRRNLRKRHRRSNRNKKAKSPKNTIELHGRTPLLEPGLALASAVSDKMRQRCRSRSNASNISAAPRIAYYELKRVESYTQTIGGAAHHNVLQQT